MSQIPPQPVSYSMSPKPTSALAIISLILGILALIPCFGIGILPGIVAIILGILALKAINAGEASGGGLAKAGLILGCIGVLLGLIGLGMLAFGIHKAGTSLQDLQRQIDDAAKKAQQQNSPTPSDTTTPPAPPPATTPGASNVLPPSTWHWVDGVPTPRLA